MLFDHFIEYNTHPIVSGKGSASETSIGPRNQIGRIIDLGSERTEVAGRYHVSLSERRHCRNAGHWLAQSNSLVVGKEECLILPDRSSNRSAKFVSAERRLCDAGAVIKKRIRIELVVP